MKIAITVVDLQKESVVGSLDLLECERSDPSSFVLLQKWNDAAGR